MNSLMEDIQAKTKEKMELSVERLKTELKNIRSNRANPGMLENVNVEVYGTNMHLRDIASITAPEPQQILITPYDSNNVNSIAKGIEKANLNLQGIADGNVVRINVPPMDATTRQEMAKLCKKKCEESKISIRNARRDANEHIKQDKADGNITEDVMKKLEKEIQELTDKSGKTAEELTTAKEKDVLAI